jgi:hypothetical protein
MIGAMIEAAVRDHLPPDQSARLVALVTDATDRLSLPEMMAVMGELMAVQSLVNAGAVEAASARVAEMADRYDAHELAAFLGELARGSDSDHE